MTPTPCLATLLRPHPWMALPVVVVLLGLATPAAADDDSRWWGREDSEGAPAAPYVYEPVDSWIHEEIERELALGNLTGFARNTRPYPRALIARQVAMALSEGRRSVGLSRLAREFLWESRFVGLGLEGNETHPWISLGPRESHVKFNGLITLAGEFEEQEKPILGSISRLGMRGVYWGPPGFSLMGEYMISEEDNALRDGNVVIEGLDYQFNTPRYAATFHGRFWELHAGRDRLRWGPARSGGLLLGGASEPFVQAGYRVQVGSRLTATAVHGWLSQAEGRYAAWHRVEADLGRGWRVGAGEGVRYDGTSPDLHYLVNVIPYAAVERLSRRESNFSVEADSLHRSNYMAVADIAWTFRSGSEIYVEVLVDDYKNDRSGPTRGGYQLGLLQVIEGSQRLTLRAEYTRVFSYTYSVFYGRHFEHAGDPLGYPQGPGVEDARLWADLDLGVDWAVQARGSFRRKGEGDLGQPWCPDNSDDIENRDDCIAYGRGFSGRDFLGVVERRLAFEVGPLYAPRDNLRFEAAAGLAVIRNADHVDGDDQTHLTARLRAAWRW